MTDSRNRPSTHIYTMAVILLCTGCGRTKWPSEIQSMSPVWHGVAVSHNFGNFFYRRTTKYCPWANAKTVCV